MMKQLLLEILEYLKFQVAEDRCTPEEMRSMYDTITENIEMDATISDIARHYGQSESNVRNVAARSYTGKPKRRVCYDFLRFARCVPRTWHRKGAQHTTT